MASVLTREGSHVAYQIPFRLIHTSNGYIASNDDINVTAVGDTIEEVKKHFREAVLALVKEFGADLIEQYRDAEFDSIDLE